MSKFKVKAGGRYRGKSGTVYRVLDNSENEYWPLCSDHEPFNTRHFWRTDGTAWEGHEGGGDNLVRAAFNVGDRVRVTSVGVLRVEIGAEGVVRHVSPKGGVEVEFTEENGTKFTQVSSSATEFELIEPDAATAENWDFDPRRELKVGDRVYACWGETKGFGEIVEDDLSTSGMRYRVRFDEKPRHPLWVEDDTVVLQPAPTPSSDPEPDLSVLVIADMSQLDDEIDRILQRLKKVKKKARKLGIRLDFRDAA